MTTVTSILVVEDEAALRDAYELIFNSAGFRTTCVKNGLEALKELKRRTPDVILLDVYMPQMNGQEVLQNIDKDEYPDMKIIVCSNMSDNVLQREVMRSGADKFVLKSSLGPQELIQMVKDILQS
jgi:CheY-like chemotaxis protein